MKEKRELTVGYRSSSICDDKYPMLRLTGRWMEECGFDINTRVSVECKEGELIIKKIGRVIKTTETVTTKKIEMI